MRSPKKKPTAAKLRRWRVSILRQRAHNLGTIEAAPTLAFYALGGLGEASRAGFLVQRGFALPTECRSKSEHLATAYVNDYAHLIFLHNHRRRKAQTRCEPALKP